MLSGTPNKVAVGILIVVVIGLVYLLWTKSASPTPTIPPDQSLAHPFGTGNPGPNQLHGGLPFPR